MPRERIPMRKTNKFKLDTCMDFLEKKEKGLPQRQYCRENSLDPATLRTWLRKLDRIMAAVGPGVDGNTRGRPSALTLGGSGRISATDPIEDAASVRQRHAAGRPHGVVQRDRGRGQVPDARGAGRAEL